MPVLSKDARVGRSQSLPNIADNDTNHITFFNEIGSAFAAKVCSAIGIEMQPIIISSSISLASTVVSLISSMYLCISKGAGARLIYSIPVVSTLTSLVSQLALIVKVTQIGEFDIEKAQKILQVVIEWQASKQQTTYDAPLKTFSNAFNAPDLVHYALKICTLLFTAGMIKYDWKVSDINAFLTLNEKTSKATGDVQTFIADIFNEFGWYDLSGKAERLRSYKDLLDLSLKLISKTPADYIIDPAAYQELTQCVEDISSLILKPLDKDDYHQFTTVRNQLSNMLVKLTDLKTDIDIITDGQNRIATTGLILEGDPGVGKSEFAHYIMAKVCASLALPKAVYNLKLGSSNKFFEPYANQCAGIINEFGAENNAEGTLQHINSIVSSDPFTFESAFVKTQPCKLRIVACTSNRNEYNNFIKQLNEGAVCAMFSRFLRVRVTDSKFQGRWQPNLHRRADFSHLNFTILEPKHPNPTKLQDLNDVEEKNVTLHQLHRELNRRCAQAEKHYIDRVVHQDSTSEQIKEVLQTRKLFLDSFFFPTTVQVPTQSTTSNATTRHCVIRMQGGVGRGKTTIINRTVAKLSHIFNMKIERITDVKELVPDKFEPKIYVFDDFPIEDHVKEYLDLVNQMHMHSIVFIGTNLVVPHGSVGRFSKFHIQQARTLAFGGYEFQNLLNPLNKNFFLWMFITFITYIFMQPPTTAYTPTDSNLHIPISKYGGIIRRVGLMSRVIESGVPINLPYKTGLCLTSQVNGTFTTADGKHHNPDAIDELIAQHYVSYLRESSEIPIVNQEPPAFEPDVHILIRNFDLWREQVKTENGYSEMYLSSTHPAGRVTVKSDFISKFMDRTQIKYWVMPNLNNVEDLTQSVKILCATLRNAIPDIKVKVHSDTFSYSLIDRVLYIHQAPIHINTIKIQENYVTFDSIPVDPIEFSKFFYYPQELHNLTTLQVFTPIQLGAIKMWFESNEEWRVLPLYDTAMSLVRQEFENRSEMVKHPIYTYFKTMTTATKVLSALLGVFTLTATIYTIYRLCTRESSDKSNTTLDPRLEAKYESYQREYVDGVMSGKYKDRGDFAAAIAARTGDSNLATGWVNYNYDITANSKEFDREKLMFSLCRAIKEKDESTAKLIFDQINKQKPLDVQDITNIVRQNTNAVSVHYEHTPDKTLIGKFVEVLQKNVCKVVSNGRHCYGIFVKDNILVTVAHLFDGPKDDVSIYWSSNTHDMSNLYKAKITNINYDKDLAILRIVDTSFPMQKDITKHLPYACDTETWSGSCYYIRPLTKTMIYHGAATKHHYTLQKRWDANNPRYRPRVWYTYEYTQCLHVSDVFKDGDCGFPLVTVKDNKCYILGIHNGYDGTGSSFFSPLTCNEFQLLREVQIPKETVSNALEIANTRVVSDKPHVDLPPYNTIINEQTITPDKLWEKYHNQLDIVGRCSNMYFHTNPKHVKKNFHDSNCQLENPSLPSPLDLKMLPTETIIKLPRDSKYRPSPLMAQCLKFSKYNELNINPEIFDQAKNIQLDLYRQNYGELSILRTAQAINGTFDGPLKSLVLETSPGPYIKKMYCMDNKRALFTDVNQNDPTKPTWYVFSEHPAAKELRIHCDAIMDSWQTGVPTVVFIKDNPKVELLPKEKVLNEGKIRLFCELDLAVNIVIRRLIGDLTAKMQEFHYLTNAKLGINPYRDLHWYSKGFPKQNVDIFGYDIKRMDKNVPAALMAYFFELCKNLLKKEHQELAGAAYETCAKSLSNAVHCMEGLLYRTVRGNPSGVVGTNTINTVLLELMTIYTHIKITLQLPMEITSHTSSSYMCDIHGFLTGDNGYIVVSKDFGYTEEKIKQGFIDFGFELLFDKSGLQGTEWCGREIYYSGGFLIPALRKEAIVRQIFWINMGRRADIPNQFLIVQMEAAMHDRHFFQQVKADILYIAKKIKLSASELVLLDYDKQRSHYRRYVCGEVSSPILTVQGTDNLLNILNIDTKSKVIMSINWVGRYYERCAKEKLPISPDEQYTYSSTAIAWQCTVTDQGYIGQGSGPRKPEAKNAAYGVLYESRFGSTTISNAGFSTGSIHKHSVRYSYDYDHNLSTAFITIFSDKNALVKIKCNVTQQEVSSIITRVISERELYVEAFHDYMTRKYNLFEPNSPLPPDECPEVVSTFEDEARPSTTSNSKLIRIPMEKLTDEQKLAIDPEYFTNKKQQEELAAARNKLTNRAAFGDISTHIRQRSLVKISETASLINSCERPSSHSNSSGDNPNLAVTGSEDAVSQGSSNRGGIAPQATSTIATPQPPEQIIESTGGLAKTTVLNPYGPVNRMTEGAITFDYPSLVYSQFMDTDQTYRITDSMAANQIILQIPYDPLSQYMNDYIRTYVGLHSRYNGDIIIRVNTISNQTFSGAMIVSWFPTQYPAEVASRPNIQKYSYQIMALVMPSTEYYILKDARQYLYYRETSDTDIPTRPHLVFAVHLPLRSPLKDGVFADIVIGSRLCNQFDAKFGAIPFYVANPILVPIGPTPGGDTLNGKALSEVFPTYDINFLNMCIDGITTLPQYSLLDQQGMEIFFDLRSPVPCLTGGVFPDANNRRLVATDFEQGVIQNDQIRVCVVISRLSLNESKTVANTQTFIDTCKGDNWLEQCKTAAWLRTVVSVYCSRNNSATLNVYTKDSFKIDLVQQTTMVTSIGLIYILCYNSNVPSNNLTYAAMGGIPDQAQPTAIVIPHNPVLGAVDTSDRLVPLPQLWAALKFTTLNPGIVTSNAEIAPTLVTEASILKKFDDLSAGLPSDQCIQFELLEPVAQTRVAIVRYLHVQRDFVISPADGINYKRYPNSASHLVISQYGTVRTNSGFPQTETPGWPKRFPDSNLMTESYYRRVPTISNAAIAAAEVLPESIIGMDSAIADLGEAIQNRRIQQTMFREPQTRGAMTTNTANARSSNPIFRPQTGGSDKYLDYLIYGVLPYASTQSNGNMATGIAGAIERPVEFSQNMNFQRSQNELDREQALLMQSNSQDFQKNLQQATFQQQKDLEMQREQFETGQQERGFKFQTDLNNQRFGQEKELQNNTFSQQTNILTQQENFAKQMNSTEFGEHMIEAATGGVLSLANTTIGKVGDYVLENQRYNDQKRLMTQNANLQIQTSGMTSQAMRIGDQY